jgi:hypothetical protein
MTFVAYIDPSAIFQFSATRFNTSGTERAVLGYAKLKAGWHFGKGEAPVQDTIDLAIKLLRYATQIGLTKSDAFPGVNGEIQLSFYRGETTIELIVEPNQTVSIFYETSEHEDQPIGGRSYDETIIWLSQISGRIWNTHISLAQSTLMSSGGGTHEWHSGTQAMGAVHRWYNWAVQSMGDEPSVPIYGTSTDHGLAVIRPSSGYSRTRSSRKAVA